MLFYHHDFSTSGWYTCLRVTAKLCSEILCAERISILAFQHAYDTSCSIYTYKTSMPFLIYLQHSDLKHLPNGYGLSCHHHSTKKICPFGHRVIFRQPDVVPMVMMEDCWLTGPVGSGDRLVLPHAASSVATCNVQTKDAIVKIVLIFLQHGG